MPPAEAMERAYIAAEMDKAAVKVSSPFEKKARHFYGYNLPFVGYSFSRKSHSSMPSPGLAPIGAQPVPAVGNPMMMPILSVKSQENFVTELAQLNADLNAERQKLKDLEGKILEQETLRVALELTVSRSQELAMSEAMSKKKLELELLEAKQDMEVNKTTLLHCSTLTQQLQIKSDLVADMTQSMEKLADELDKQKHVNTDLESLCREQKEMILNLSQEISVLKSKVDDDGSKLTRGSQSFENEKSILMSQLSSLQRELSLQAVQKANELNAKDREFVLKAKELAMLQSKADECAAKLADVESQWATSTNETANERVTLTLTREALEREISDKATLQSQVEALTEKIELDRVKIEGLISKLQQTLTNGNSGMGSMLVKPSTSAEDKKALILAKQEIQNLKMRLESALADKQRLQEELQDSYAQQTHEPPSSLTSVDHFSKSFKRLSLKSGLSLQRKNTVNSDKSSLSSVFVNRSTQGNMFTFDTSGIVIEGWLKIPMTGSQGLFRSKWRKVYAYILHGRLYVGEKENDYSLQRHPLIDLSEEFISIRSALAVELPRLPSREIPCAFKILVSYGSLSTSDSRLFAESNATINAEAERSTQLEESSMDTKERLATLLSQIEKEEKLIEAASRMKTLYESTLCASLANKKKSTEMAKQVSDTEKQLEGYRSLLTQLKSQYEILSRHSLVESETEQPTLAVCSTLLQPPPPYPLSSTAIDTIMEIDSKEEPLSMPSLSSDADSLLSARSLTPFASSSHSSPHKFSTVEFKGHTLTEKAFSALTTCMHCRQLLYGAKKHFGYQCQGELLPMSCQNTCSCRIPYALFFLSLFC